MHRWATVVILLALTLSGCARHPQFVSRQGGSLPSPGGLRIAGFVHDGPGDSADASAALLAGQRQFRSLVDDWYEYPEDRPKGMPRTAAALVRQSKLSLVPIYGYAGTTSEASSVAGTVWPTPRDYLLVMSRAGVIVGSCDWSSPPPRGQAGDEDPQWGSFYGDMSSLDISAPERQLRVFFGDGEVQVRVVGVPRGYWVVGSRDGVERGVWIGHQGDFDDDPRGDRLYRSTEMLAYGAPHGDGR